MFRICKQLSLYDNKKAISVDELLQDLPNKTSLSRPFLALRGKPYSAVRDHEFIIVEGVKQTQPSYMCSLILLRTLRWCIVHIGQRNSLQCR